MNASDGCAIVFGLVIGIFFISWLFTVSVLYGLVWLLNLGGIAIQFNIWLATAAWIILTLFAAFLSK